MKTVNGLIGVVFALILSSCGMIDTMNRMEDHTKELSQKMDQTNQGIDKTNTNVEKTNIAVDKTNVGMEKTIEGINKTNGGMEKTNEGIHKQTLTVALQQMLETQNTEFLNPPLSILPAAQVFSQEATALELLELSYVYYMDIQKGYNKSAKYPTEQEMRIHTRSVRWAVIGALAAQTSDEKFEEMQRTQVVNPGRYQNAAKMFAVARYDMIKTAFYTPLLRDEDARNLGGLKKAVQYYRSMKKVADLPYFVAAEKPAYSVVLNEIIVGEEEVVPDPAKPTEKIKVKTYNNAVIRVESPKQPFIEGSKPEIVRFATQCKSFFGKTEGEEAKQLLEEFNK